MNKATEHGPYTYNYDSLYRLVTADGGPLTAERFSYDSVGNRLTSSTATNCSYNANNELQSYNGVSFQYDLNGNTTQKNDNGTIQNFLYNEDDRLTEVRDGGGSVKATYYYDPFGRRLWKEIGGARTYFMYADEGLIAEFDGTGSQNKAYGYAPNSTWTTNPLFMKQGSQYYFYNNDHLGTPQKITAVNGSTVWSAKHESFGKAVVDPASTVVNNLRFPGQYYDQETGFHYNYHRYYESRTGRYLTIDPLMSDLGLTLYSYARNNPVAYNDAEGLMVYQCYRKADIPFNESLGLPHTWLKTSTKEAGLGPADGRIPGVGPQKDSPYVSETMIVDHTGESQRPEAWCIPLPDVPEDCVNDKLVIGKPQGKWTVFNQCWSFIEKIKIECRHRCLN